jgi:coenzyme Q-binding protein COQ10
MAHLMNDFHVNIPVAAFDALVKDPRTWPTFWVGMDGSPRVFGDGSPGTKAEFFQHMMGMKLRMVDRTIEERHNPDGSTDWRWQFEGAMSGSISCHHEPSGDGTDVTTTFDYDVPARLGGRVTDRLVLQRRMRHDFEDSMDNLKLLAETSAVATTASVAA